MSSLLAQIRAKRAARGGPPPSSTTIVSDLERIAALPRRTPQSDVTEIATLVTNFSQRLKTTDGTMQLRAAQALALYEAEQTQGLFANLGVGLGKTLLGLLLPVVLESSRCVLLIPSGLKAQLLQKAYPELAKHWGLPKIAELKEVLEGQTQATIVVVTHNEVSQQRTSDCLRILKPDLYVIDEAHAFAQDSARGRRLFDDVGSRRNAGEQVRVCVMSGTLIDSALSGASRMASLSLGTNSPYPRYQADVGDLAMRIEANDGDYGPWAKVYAVSAAGAGGLRSAVRTRVLETPGVTAASGVENVNASLVLRARKPSVPASVKAALKTLRNEWTTPNGDELTEIIDYSRHIIELSQGHCYRWDWPDGVVDEVWLEARRAWGRAVRRKLQTGPRPGMDSEGLLKKAAASGAWKCAAWPAWAAVMDREPPPTVVDWVSEFLVEDAVEWGRDAQFAGKAGIIWYEHSASGIGRRIADLGGFPLYEGGDGPGPEILERGDRTIVCSRPAYYFGRELQCFSRMLVLCPMSGAKAWEQLLGRTHRSGQKAAAVEVDICMHTPELKANFESALEEARRLKESAPGYENQKLLFADVIL